MENQDTWINEDGNKVYPISVMPEKEWLLKDDGVIYVRRMIGEIVYAEEIECYDKNGNKIGKQRGNLYYKKNQERHVEPFDYDWGGQVIQIDFNFYLASIGRSYSIPEISYAERLLNDSNLGRFDYGKNISDLGYEYNVLIHNPVEIVKIGHSNSIFRKSIKSFMDLDYIEYEDKINTFISCLKKYKNVNFLDSWLYHAKKLYNENVLFASKFYNVPIEKIKKNNFNRQECLIKRLQEKINKKKEYQLIYNQ